VHIVESIEVDTSTVSKHISIMKHAKVVNTEKRRNDVYYSLNMPCAILFFDCVKKCIRDDLTDKPASIKK